MTAKESVGQRGKQAEREVEAVLKRWNNQADFSHYRFPDARAAMGRLSAAPGDFLYFKGGSAGVIEVKSTQHATRIAKDKVSQLPTLHKFAYAGAKSVLLVNHSEAGTWRAVKPELLEIGPASWDLSGFQAFNNPEDALKSTGYFGE